tara:strand:- start:41311 stop:41526 length:216 start_codon:yes stop_codon:yes gene_type:complete
VRLPFGGGLSIAGPSFVLKTGYLWTQPRRFREHNAKLKRAIADGEPVRFADVKIDETATADKLRRWMEGLI